MDKRNLIKISRWVVMAVFCFSLNVANVVKGEEPLQKNPTEQTKEEETQTPQATITATPVQEIELEVMWEKQFDEPVVDVIFDEAETTIKEAKTSGWKDLEKKKESEKVILPRTKVLITEEKVKFYNDKGEIKKELDIKYIGRDNGLPTIRKSKNEKFIGIKTISEMKTNEKGIVSVDGKFTMLDNDGNILWETQKYFYDFIPSPDGQYVIELPDPEYSQAPLVIYNKQGIVKEIQKPSRGYSLDFSENGEYIALTLDSLRKDKKGYLILLSKDGHEYWKQEIGVWPWSVSISGNSELIAAVGGEYKDNERNIYVFDKSGNLLLKKNIHKTGTYEIKFSHDNKLLLATNGGYIYLFDVEKNNLVWENKIDIKGFGGMCTTPDFNLILIAYLGYGEREDYIYLFDKEGKKVFTKKFEISELLTEKFWPYRVLIKLSLKEPKIFIKTKSGIKILKYDFLVKE